MANPDLRDWLAQLDDAGVLQRVSGAERMEEIGGIVDIYQRQTGRPTLLFDDIPGYPRGYRVAADAVGAGLGEVVLYATGSSARMTRVTDQRPCDGVIMAIVDQLEVDGVVTYDKAEAG